MSSRITKLMENSASKKDVGINMRLTATSSVPSLAGQFIIDTMYDPTVELPVLSKVSNTVTPLSSKRNILDDTAYKYIGDAKSIVTGAVVNFYYDNKNRDIIILPDLAHLGGSSLYSEGVAATNREIRITSILPIIAAGTVVGTKLSSSSLPRGGSLGSIIPNVATTTTTALVNMPMNSEQGVFDRLDLGLEGIVKIGTIHKQNIVQLVKLKDVFNNSPISSVQFVMDSITSGHLEAIGEQNINDLIIPLSF